MFEAYKIGVRVSLVNEVSRGLLLMSGQFRGAEKDAAGLQRRMEEIRRLSALAFAGGSIAAGGMMGLGFISKLLKPAEEYTHQLALMNAQNIKGVELAKATAAAWETTRKVQTTTVSENLQSIREMLPVFGDLAHAIQYLPQVQRVSATLQSTLHGQGGVEGKDVAFAATKALEMRGVSMNPVAFTQQMDLIAKAVIATGGKVTPNSILQAQKYSGQYGSSFSNDFMYGILPTLVQEYGGSSTGTALTSMMQALTGGRMTPQAAKAFSQLKLNGKPLLDMKQYTDFRNGLPGTTALGALQGTDKGITNPFEWVQKYLEPALKQAGINDPAHRAAMLGMLFSNRTAARMVNLLDSQGPRLMKDFHIIGSAQTAVDPSKDPVLAQKAMEAQWENTKTALGNSIVPIIVPAMLKLADSLNKISKWATDHPTLFSGLAIGFGTLSAAMAITGTVAALAFSIKGLGTAIGNPVLTSGLMAIMKWANGMAVAGAVGYGAGTFAYDNWIDGTKFGDWLGKNLARGMALMGSDEAREALDYNSRMSKIHADKTPVYLRVDLDGKKVAEVVTKHQSNGMSKPPSSPNGYNMPFSLPFSGQPVGFN